MYVLETRWYVAGRCSARGGTTLPKVLCYVAMTGSWQRLAILSMRMAASSIPSFLYIRGTNASWMSQTIRIALLRQSRQLFICNSLLQYVCRITVLFINRTSCNFHVIVILSMGCCLSRSRPKDEDEQPTQGDPKSAQPVSMPEVSVPQSVREQDDSALPVVNQEIEKPQVSVCPTSQQQQEQICQLIMSAISQVHQHYSNHDIDSSIAALRHYDKTVEEVCQQMKTTENDIFRELSYVHKLTRQIKTEYKHMEHIDSELERGGWEEKDRTKEMTIHARRQSDSSVGAIVEIDLSIPFQIFVSIITEPDLFKEYVPFLEESKMEKHFSRNCKVGYALSNIPFLTRRESFFQGVAYSRLRTHGQFMICTQSLYQNEELQEHLGYKIKPNSEYVQLLYKYFVIKYRPIRQGFGKLTLAANVDFGLNFLPNFILEAIVTKFGKDFLKSVIKVSKNFKGSAWERKIAQNPSGFNWFKKEIGRHLEKSESD